MAGAYPRGVRLILSLVAGTAVAAVGAAVLGEYAFDGPAVVGSGLVLGLFVAEAMVTLAKGGSRLGAAWAGAITGVGLLLAAWTSTGHRLATVRPEGWAAIALGVAVAAFRARPAPARDSHPAPAAE